MMTQDELARYAEECMKLKTPEQCAEFTLRNLTANITQRDNAMQQAMDIVASKVPQMQDQNN